MELTQGCKIVRFNWVFQTKLESHGNIERYKPQLVAKGFTHKDYIDYKETFLLRAWAWVIMELVAHYESELHQMSVMIAFWNGNLEVNVYMDQPIGFGKKGKEHMVWKLKKSIYGLK